MARLSDHDQRDAEHALRAEITLELARYARRMADKGKAIITEAISQAVREGKDIDGTAIGRAAAARVKAEYFATSKPEPALETRATSPAREIGTGDYTADRDAADGGTRTDCR